MARKLPPPLIPDYSGPPIGGLADKLAEIDRRYGGHPMRRALRAAAAYNHGDAVRWHIETNVALDEFAFEQGLSRSEMDKLTLPCARWVENRLRQHGL